MTSAPRPTTESGARLFPSPNGEGRGEVALLALTLCAWLLVLFAQLGWFSVAWLTLLPLAAALIFAALTWWRADLFTRIATIAIVIAGALLYLPPAQHLALNGDGAIYINEGAFLARTGKLHGTHDALAALSSEAASLFYISSDEQFPWDQTVEAYDGLLYGGYYVADASTAQIESSRMPQVVAWHGLASLLAPSTTLTFYVSALFAIAAALMLFACASLLYGRWIALWAALLLTVCYPQIYVARGALAESVGAFWTLAGVWFALRWLRNRSPYHLLLALLMWVTSWAARVDALLLLAPAALLVAIAAADRDRPALRWATLGAPLLLFLAVLGANATYLSATLQLFTSFITLLAPALIVLVFGIPLLALAAWYWGAPAVAFWRRIERPALMTLLGIIATVVLWATLPGPWRDATIERPFQEIIWFSSLYFSPAIYWLAVVGLGALFWRGLDRTSFFLTGTLLVLAVAYLHGYTSANVYPISLRRLTSDLLPMLLLIGGFAFTLAPATSQWRWLSAAVAGATLLWVGWLSAPLVPQREYPNDLAFVRTLHETLPADAALIFEPQSDSTWIGWLAAPLFSLYGDWTLLLDTASPDPSVLARALDELIAAGRTPLVVSQTSPLPSELTPPGFRATLHESLLWESAQIGQSRPPETPAYWEFSLPLHLYRLEPEQ